MILLLTRGKQTLAFSLGLFLILCFSNRAEAHPGDIDPSFGTNGRVVTSIGTFDSGTRMTLQADGKIVVAGVTRRPDSSGYNDLLLMRYNPNGTLDATFDGDGKLTMPVGPGQVYITDVIMQGGNKIIVVGTADAMTTQALSDIVVMRFNPNGTLDTTFDTDGIVMTDINNTLDGASAVTIQPDGKIVVAGGTYQAGSYWTIVRYNPNGSLDTTFDTDGIVRLAMNELGNSIAGVALQSNGKIVVAGAAHTGFGFNGIDFFLIRFNSDGSLDGTFGGPFQARTFTDFYQKNDGIKAFLIKPDDKIVAVGAVDTNTFSGRVNAAVAQYSANGILEFKYDMSWRSLSADNATGVALQPDGKVIVSGFTNSTDDPQFFDGDFAAFRLLPNTPTPDNSFGTNGTLITDVLTDSSDSPSDMALQQDGKFIILGNLSFTGGQDVAMVRYHGNNTTPAARAPFDFDGDNKTDLSIYRPSVGEWWYLKSSDGGNGAFQFGISTDKLVPADYTGDGKTDIAFYRPSSGEWFVLRSENNSFYSFPFGNAGDVPQVGDFDADGKADPTIYRPSTSVWYTRRSTDGVAVIQGFGQAGDVPVPADYDGDGKADLAIFRPSVGEWWILRSTLGGIAYQFGNSSDKPVQGDFTGDGKADVAFFRPSNGEWFVLRSENLSYYSFPFGSNGDIAAPGDYDGDGKFDAAVFRPSSNTWYAQRATAGTLIQSFGQSGDKPVPNAFVP